MDGRTEERMDGRTDGRRTDGGTIREDEEDEAIEDCHDE